MTKLEEEFTKKAVEQAQAALLAHGCPTKRLLMNLEAHGGLKTCRELAGKHRLSDGFRELAACGHLELSPEALMTRARFGALFTDDEVNWCLDTLMEYGYF